MRRNTRDAHSGSRSAGGSNFVDAFVETLKHPPDRNSKNLTDPEQSCHGDWSASFDLLPVPGRKTEGDQFLLAKTAFLSQFADSLAEAGKGFRLIWHPPVCKDSQAETPRAD